MVGQFENPPVINSKEVENWKWMPLEAVKLDIDLQPALYTEWFKIIFEKFYEHINTTNESNSK
jgi:isopentenyl-diphosphate delta-isomerase